MRSVCRDGRPRSWLFQVSDGNHWPDADRTLDATGDLCPIPIVKTADTLRQMPRRNVLEILSDDSGITEDLPAWCEANNQTLIKLDKGEQTDVYHGFVRKETVLD